MIRGSALVSIIRRWQGEWYGNISSEQRCHRPKKGWEVVEGKKRAAKDSRLMSGLKLVSSSFFGDQ